MKTFVRITCYLLILLASIPLSVAIFVIVAAALLVIVGLALRLLVAKSWALLLVAISHDRDRQQAPEVAPATLPEISLTDITLTDLTPLHDTAEQPALSGH